MFALGQVTLPNSGLTEWSPVLFSHMLASRLPIWYTCVLDVDVTLTFGTYLYSYISGSQSKA